MRRSACLAVLAACLLGSATVTLEGRVKLEDNRLYVDGKPFFPYGCWGCIESVESMKQHHFNCVFSGMDGTADLLEEAAEEDFFVITYPYAPRWGMQHEEHILAVRDHPNLLAWNIGDDLKATDVEKVRHAYEYIRQHDPYHRPVMLDVIHGWEKYTWFEQMFCAYTYPLVKRPTLLEYQQFLRDRHAIVGADKFLWTWAQAHVQDWYTAMYLGPEASLPRSLYPDGTEMRLVVYSALAAGCRGILYFPSPFFTEDFHGVDRYAEAALIGVELKVIGPWLAEGVVGKHLWTSEPTLHAWPVDFPGGTLVLLMHIDDETQYHVGAARAEGTVMLPRRSRAGEHVYELSLGDGAREITSRVRDGKCGVSFQMTDLLLITDDQALAREADAKLGRLLADSARYAAQAAGAKRRKVQRVLAALHRTRYPDAEALSASVRSAGALIHDANELIARAEFAAAFRSARGADRVLREAVRDHWRRMNADPFVREMMVLPNFYLAEGYYPMVRAMTEAEPSGNLLPNG
ncbi:MAG: hypothetical protein U9R79_09640, partial [Armatimonadota bacterium]|nr:hypothetical protein [Armatimonadota bacterium]